MLKNLNAPKYPKLGAFGIRIWGSDLNPKLTGNFKVVLGLKGGHHQKQE